MRLARRTILASAAVLALGLSLGHQVRAASPQAATDFIRKLGTEAISVLADKSKSQADREAAFRKLFVQSFDIDAISQFVLGRYWRSATEAQRVEYQKLFQSFIVASYAAKLGQYSGERFSVRDARTESDGDSVVPSQVERTDGGPPVRVDWRLKGPDNAPKIIDVVVEGVSMAVTHRSEFASVIQNNGGNVDALLTALKKRAGQS